MLSPKLLQLLSFQFKLATTLKCFPFEWDNSRSILKLVPIRIRRIKFITYFITTLDLMVGISTVFGFFHFVTFYYPDMVKIIPVFIFGLCLLAGIGILIFPYFYQLEILILANKLIQNNTKIRKLHFSHFICSHIINNNNNNLYYL